MNSKLSPAGTLGHINLFMARWLPPQSMQDRVKAMASALREKFETHRSVSGEIFTDPFREYRGEELQV
jgi:hypothetical protein